MANASAVPYGGGMNAAWRQRGRTVPEITNAPPDTSEQQRDAARRTVARLTLRAGLDAHAAAEVMLQLGIFPGQEKADFQIPALDQAFN